MAANQAQALCVLRITKGSKWMERHFSDLIRCPDEPPACILHQMLAPSHRAQALTYSKWMEVRVLCLRMDPCRINHNLVPAIASAS